jgi:diguanylate cyclase (GGDEF)-like protein
MPKRERDEATKGRRDEATATGLWLTCGGLAILAAHHLLAAYETKLSVDNLVLLVGAITGYLVTAAGICLSVRSRHRSRSTQAAATSTPAGAGEHLTVSEHRDLARQMTNRFLAWCEEDHSDSNLWNSFDQLVREMLTEQLGAARVRCYQVLPGSQQLRGLSQLATLTDGQCARRGILGHVATGGQEFVATDPTHGELIDQLAQDADESWDWVYPIRHAGQTTGLLAVGKLPATTLIDRERRQDISILISAFWQHVACLEQLRIAEKTDKASGLLTRTDFFQAATRALADSYAENEPVVVVVLVLEGLRRLDDIGRWNDRDALVETAGRLINRRIRTDDIIGRFSDDRFVLLLRRLDSSLGRLIAAKIQDRVQEHMGQLGDTPELLQVRVGLSGSGFQQQSLETLLVAAFDAVELARKQNVPLLCDLPTATRPAAAGVSP